MSKNQLNEKAIKALAEISSSPSSSVLQAKQDEQQAKIHAVRQITEGNALATFDALLISDPSALREFNYSMEKWCKRMSPDYNYRPVNYASLVEDLPFIEDEQRTELKRAFDTQAGTTFGLAQSTTVADMLVKTVGELSQIYSRVKKYDLQGAGNMKVIVNTVKTRSAWRTSQTADFVDNSNTIEAGNVEVNFTPNSVGAVRTVTFEFKNKLTPYWMAEALQLLMEEQFRAYDHAIILGTGLNNNPLGMNVNALVGVAGVPNSSQFALGGDLFETLVNAQTVISNATKRGKKDMVLFCNSTFENELLKLRYSMNNDDISGIITVADGSVKKVAGIEVVPCEEVIETTNGVSTATLAVPELYAWGESAPIEVVEDASIGIKAKVMTMVISGIADGKPVLNNAFAKINSNNT